MITGKLDVKEILEDYIESGEIFHFSFLNNDKSFITIGIDLNTINLIEVFNENIGLLDILGSSFMVLVFSTENMNASVFFNELKTLGKSNIEMKICKYNNQASTIVIITDKEAFQFIAGIYLKGKLIETIRLDRIIENG